MKLICKCSTALLSILLPPLAGAQPTVGGGTLTSPAVGPAPAYSYGYGNDINGAVLVKNWDFGTGSENTIHTISELTTHFQYHDQFGRDHGTGYGSSIVAPPGAPTVSGQPVEGVNTPSGTPIREFLGSSMKTYLVPLNGATTADPALRNVGNGGFQAKWTAPNGGSLLGKDIIWETRVRYVTPAHFWFAIWTCGNSWAQPNPSQGIPGGAEMDLIESFGYNNGSGSTNYDGRYWHSNAVGGADENQYPSWGGGMSNYGISSYDATQWHTWTWVYRADNTYTVFVDGIPVQRGKMNWTFGGRSTDPAINMSFIFDGAWGHQTVGGMGGFTIPVSQLAGKYYEWDYSRIYYRDPAANDIRNLALTATISSSSGGSSGAGPEKAIDDIYGTDDNRWSPSSSGFPRFIEIDLGANKWVHETQFLTYKNRAFRYRLEAKPDGGAYTTVSDQTASTNTSWIRTDSFTPMTARYVKLTYTGSPNGATWVGIREIRVMGRPNPPAVPARLDGTVIAWSTQESANPASRAYDNISNDSANRWSAISSGYPQHIEVDLGANRQISATELTGYSTRSYRFRVSAKPDGGTYATIVDRTSSTATSAVVADSFTPVTARYVKLVVTGASNYTGNWVSIREFRVIGTP